MKYICELCNYESCDSSNFLKHKNTKKHVQNAQHEKNGIFDQSKVNRFIWKKSVSVTGAETRFHANKA